MEIGLTRTVKPRSRKSSPTRLYLLLVPINLCSCGSAKRLSKYTHLSLLHSPLQLVGQAGREAGKQERKYQPISQEGLTGAERGAAQTDRQTDRHGRVNAFTPHSDVLLCHPSRESITVSSRLAARHEKRQAQKGEGRGGKRRMKEWSTEVEKDEKQS